MRNDRKFFPHPNHMHVHGILTTQTKSGAKESADNNLHKLQENGFRLVGTVRGEDIVGAKFHVLMRADNEIRYVAHFPFSGSKAVAGLRPRAA